MEQHVIYIRLATQAQRRAAVRLLERLSQEEVDRDDIQADGRYEGFYWAARMMGDRGRLRFPEGHPQAGGLISGHFFILVWQGPRDLLPAVISQVEITRDKFDTIYPGFPPEVMG